MSTQIKQVYYIFIKKIYLNKLKVFYCSKRFLYDNSSSFNIGFLSPVEAFRLVRTPFTFVLVVDPHFSLVASEEVINIEYVD